MRLASAYLLLVSLFVVAVVLTVNDFVKMGLFGLPIYPLECLAMISAFVGILLHGGKKIKIMPANVLFYAFVLWGGIYVVLSYMGIFKDLAMANGFEFKTLWIPRQAYFILDGAMICFGIYMAVLKAQLKGSYWISFLIMTFVPIMVLQDYGFNKFSLAFFVYLAAVNPHSRVMRMMLACAVIYSLRTTSITNKILGVSVLFFAFVPFAHQIFAKYTRWFVGAALALILYMTFGLDHSVLYETDGNIWWRAVYWDTLLQKIAHTFGAGYGFGTAYAPNELIDQILIVQDDYGADSVFVVAPHNSYISVFFRLGIVGFLLFAGLNYVLLRDGAKAVAENRMSDRGRFAFIFFVMTALGICFNVGLESPRYLIFYLVASSWLAAEITRAQSYLAKPVSVR